MIQDLKRNGTIEKPYIGLPLGKINPKIIEIDKSADSFVSKITTPWFVICEKSYKQFGYSTYLDLYYPEEDSDDDYIEGFYLLSLLDPLVTPLFKFVPNATDNLNYGIDKLRFTSKVTKNDILRLACSIKSIRSKPSAKVVKVYCVMELYGREKPAFVTDWLIYLLYQ